LLKKSLSVLLLIILLSSSIGGVSAKSYHFNYYYEVGDTFKGMNVWDKAVDEGFMGQNIGDINALIQLSGLFTIIGKSDDAGEPEMEPGYDYIYRADKVGMNTSVENYYPSWWYDPDYYHFYVKPHEVKLDIPEYSYIDTNNGGKIVGKVNIYATNPSKSQPADNEFWNSILTINCINIDDVSEVYHADVNTGENNYFDLSSLDWHLRGNSNYGFSVSLAARGNWSSSFIFKYLS
jgi:hypothetical protein